MINLQILIVALLPVVLLLFFIYKRDPLPEPTSYLLKAFFFGVLIAIPASIAEAIIMKILYSGLSITESSVTIFNAFINGFIVAAVPEESLKLIALYFMSEEHLKEVNI